MKKTRFFLLRLLILTLVMSFNLNAAERLTAYVSLDEAVARNVLDAFTKSTGIQVDWVRLSTGEAAARIAAEKNNPKASIWVGGVGLNILTPRKMA